MAGAAAPAETASATIPSVEVPPLESVRAAFPQLEILELIGAGGMGVVFKARQPKLDRLVALKLLPMAQACDEAFAQRFNREARVLARLNHPNIVAIYDFGETGGFFHLLMEYVDGVNLRQAMQAGRFSPAEALGIVPKICEALQYAHAEGVLHRDIKPENILLDGKGRVKIADFGIAKLLGEERKEKTLTASGAAIGTPQYMAPEQIEHPQDVDHRADIYSLGVVFYEMLTGELPIGRFAPPSQKAQVDSRVDDVVFRTLEKERERRFQSASEVKTSVEGLATAPPVQDKTRVVAAGPAGQDACGKAKMSLKAVWGAICSGTGVFFGALAFLAFCSIHVERNPGPMVPETHIAWLGVLALVAVLAIAILPAIAGTLLGATALGDIRRSAGRLRGLPLAAFAALCWPLLFLDASILALFYHLAPSVIGRDTELRWGLRLGLVLTVLAILAIDVLILWATVRWATGTSKAGASIHDGVSAGGRSDAPPAGKAGSGARRRLGAVTAVIVAILAASCGLWLWLRHVQSAALRKAGENGDMAAMRALVRKGANLEIRSANGETPLIWAAAHGDPGLVRLLLQRGAAVDARDRLGQTALMVAASRGHAGAVEELLTGHAQVNEKSNDGTTPLMAAAWNGHLGIARSLLQRGASCQERDKERQTALMKAVFNGHVELTQLLVDRGAPIEAANDKGQTPLHLAAARGHTAIARFLLEHGAQPEARDQEGYTALMWAASEGHEEAADLLLSQDARGAEFLWLARAYRAAASGRAAEATDLACKALDAWAPAAGAVEFCFNANGWRYEAPNPELLLRVLLVQCRRDTRSFQAAQACLETVRKNWPVGVNRCLLYQRTLLPGNQPPRVVERYSTELAAVAYAASPNGHGTVLLEREEIAAGAHSSSSRTVDGLIH